MKTKLFSLVVLLCSSCASPHFDVDLGVSDDAESQALSLVAASVSLEYENTDGRTYPVLQQQVDGVREGYSFAVDLPEDFQREEGSKLHAVAKDDAGTEILNAEAIDDGEESISLKMKSNQRGL